MGHIGVDDVSKRFRLYTARANSVKERITARRLARYEDFWALRNVSLDIPEATTFGLIGHNGSGKSTMLRCIAGIYQPTSGSVRVDGRISALLELGAGFHPDLSGRENVYLNAAILGLSKREIDAVFDDIVDFSGIAGFVDAPVKVYSSGMFVRLGFSVAVHVDPEILLIDEVVAVGDEEFQRRCFEHVHNLRRQGVTIVMVSHNLGLVQSMCERAAWFDHGTIQVEGTSTEAATAYLAKVNAEEVADAGEVSIGISETLTRRGSGEIRFTDISIEDAHGTRTMFAMPGERLTVALAFECHEPVESPMFAVALRHESGQLMSLTSTLSDGLKVERIVCDGVARFTIPNLPLLSGSYFINVYAVDSRSTHVYDEIEHGLTLTVRGEPVRGQDGFFRVEGRWEVLQGEEVVS
jgi:ABC-2 type transport system ATP-binding protein/lipopolysaccharide transport system ATP-binding protein